jgi:hypothetical protein
MRLPPTLTAWILAGAALIGVLVVRPAPELNPENLAFAEQAQRVRRGETPLFFHVRGETWLPPLPVYLTALTETVTGPIRGGQTAGAIAGAINIALVFLIAHSITGRVAAAFAAALTLLLTGGHTALALSGAASILPATLILLWLERLLAFMKTDRPGAMIVAAASLGLCVYSHPAGPLTAVFLWILTLAVAWRRNRRRLLAGTATFVAMWGPAAAWFYLHPDFYADTFGRWVILKAHVPCIVLLGVLGSLVAVLQGRVGGTSVLARGGIHRRCRLPDATSRPSRRDPARRRGLDRAACWRHVRRSALSVVRGRRPASARHLQRSWCRSVNWPGHSPPSARG